MVGRFLTTRFICCNFAIVFLLQPLCRPMIPGILIVIGRLLEEQEDQGCEAMELLDELVECEVSIVVPHIKPCVEFCCQVSHVMSRS